MNPVPITLFAKTRGCPQCVATKKHLDRQGTPYEVRYVDEDPAAADGSSARLSGGAGGGGW